MEKATVVKTAVLEELANGNGERAGAVLKNLGQLDRMGVNSASYKSAVLELMDATLLGLLKEDNPGRGKLIDLSKALINSTAKFGYPVYEYLLMPLEFEYNKLDINGKSKYEIIMPAAVIQAGARIVMIKESGEELPGMNREKLFSTAQKILLHLADKAGPETKVRAIEALANFDGPDIKKELDALMRSGDAGIRKTAEESVAIIRAREDFDAAQRHEAVFTGMYPYEGHPKRFFVSAVYDSIRVILSDTSGRKIADSAESAVAIKQLISLIRSDNWKEQIFRDDRAEKEILETDMQNTLFHVLKRAENENLRREAARALVENGAEKAVAIFQKMVERKERGHELVGKYTIPKPTMQPRCSPPPPPGRKAVFS